MFILYSLNSPERPFHGKQRLYFGILKIMIHKYVSPLQILDQIPAVPFFSDFSQEYWICSFALLLISIQFSLKSKKPMFIHHCTATKGHKVRHYGSHMTKTSQVKETLIASLLQLIKIFYLNWIICKIVMVIKSL